jgi:hypothetical protein
MAKTVTRNLSRPVKKQVKKTQVVNPKAVEYGILIIILLVISFIRIRLSSFPLERDEGEYSYFGQLILHGVPPYKMAYNLKLPGTYFCYALIMGLFGQTAAGIRIGLLLFNLGSLLFLFYITKKLFNAIAALIAVATCSLFFVSPVFLGQAAHATHFVTFFSLGGIYFLLSGFEKRKYWIFLVSGIFMGLAFLMKQSGLFFPLFGGLMIVIRYFFDNPKKLLKSILDLVLFGAGAAIPLLITMLVLSGAGVFEKFWFWTFIYPKSYGTRVPLSQAWGNFKMLFFPMTETFRSLWIIAGLGAISLFFYRGKGFNRLFAGLYLVFAFLNAVPGFYFRSHYFIPMIPALSVMTGFFPVFINSLLEKKIPYIAYITSVGFLVLLISSLNEMKDFYFNKSPDELCRFIYQGNYFNEAIPVAKYIQENTEPTDKIFVFGSEPEIYFYSRRQSATGYIYMYDLVFDQPFVKTMQKEMIKEVEAAKPKYIVYFSCQYSWLAMQGQSDSLFSWFNNYLIKNKFAPSGVAEYLFPDPTVYVWGKDVATYQRKGNNYIYIFRKTE